MIEQVCGFQSDNPEPEHLTLKLTSENKTFNKLKVGYYSFPETWYNVLYDFSHTCKIDASSPKKKQKQFLSVLTVHSLKPGPPRQLKPIRLQN